LPEPDAHDGVTLVARDGARILAYASYSLEEQSLDDFAVSSLHGDDYARVTYRKRGKDFLVVSGLRDIEGTESLFYERYYLPPDARRSSHDDARPGPIAGRGSSRSACR
jgi:hypothetical protein